MKTKPNFLPGLSTKLQGRARRRQLETLRLRRQRARSESISDLGALFDFVLPLEKLKEFSRTLRDRIFTEEVTFRVWVSQILSGNTSCSQSLALVQRWHEEASLPVPGAGTSSYCRARQRLSEDSLDAVDDRVARHAEARREGWQVWRGHRLKAIDGTPFQLLDTPENQAEYPQPAPQAPGCGFPIVGLVGVIDLGDGRLLDMVVDREREHDAKDLYALRECFEAGDLLIADRVFCSYELIGLLRGRGVESVMRLHQKREGKLQWRMGRRLRSRLAPRGLDASTEAGSLRDHRGGMGRPARNDGGASGAHPWEGPTRQCTHPLSCDHAIGSRGISGGGSGRSLRRALEHRGEVP